ncbi:hypothetical protein BDZ91DRAFT_719535 [Kalaharituber pfeilii]|nr:hypothetical protein BDZ91DRAFT_719535 [Kalaharituber pfeilii]
MPQGFLTVYVPQLGASSPITLPVPVGAPDQSGKNRKDSESNIDRFLAGLPSAKQYTESDKLSINPSREHWILFDVGRLSYIHRSFFNVYLENLSPKYLEGRSYILLSPQAASRFTSKSLGTNFLDALNKLFPEQILYPAIDVFWKQQAQPPWDAPSQGNSKAYSIMLWIPCFTLPWDIIIRRDSGELNLESTISNFTGRLDGDITGFRADKKAPQPIVPVPLDNWALIDFKTQHIIPRAFANNIALTISESKTFILAPITLSGLAKQLLAVIKDGGVPAWEAYWKNYTAQGK